MAENLIEIEGLRREFPAGEGVLTVLNDISLSIEKGEMIAIMGASGSGKSTLMNILGCLDRPSAGSYRVTGRETAELEPDELAELRREHFGFIFQRYHLLSELTALENVEMPAIYADEPAAERRKRAVALLDRLGLGDRMGHRPGQLSGGQQQRVSIARALMNGAEVILADEPTGALDSRSGEEVLRILEELHAEGKTVVMVTHDAEVAARCRRIVELRDGEIVSDRRQEGRADMRGAGPEAAPKRAALTMFRAWSSRFAEAFRMAALSMQAHKMRTFLTMLGIIIGIASVVSVVALGQGSQKRVLSNISRLGANTLEIFPGRKMGETRGARVQTLRVGDADALARLSYIDAVTPTVSASRTIRYRTTEANARVMGVGAQYFTAKSLKILEGAGFTKSSVARSAQEAVIDEEARKTLFGAKGDALGRVILIGSVPVRVIGVVETRQFGPGGGGTLTIYMPFRTVQSRMLGDSALRSITVRVSDDVSMTLAMDGVAKMLIQRHGLKDFNILNTDEIRQTITSTTQTLALLIASIAFISLIVGGVGVMNIMLVTVSERTSEIGVRMAVGARQGDILQQFLIEAVMVCVIGGALGVATALGFGAIFGALTSSFQLSFSITSIVTAFLFSSAIGVGFGYLPARSASKLDPVAALARD
ncbi:MAG: MacB family efflux pump subunit [Neomegalonema sp.]|nr:MacB family efflux pump subunit [Neomegalonema sp.]